MQHDKLWERGRRWPIGVALWLLGLLAVARPAAADGLADEAELLFTIGAERYQKGDLQGALERFLASNRLVPNRAVLFNIARTYESMGRHAAAHRYYLDALAGESNEQTIAEIHKSLARVAPFVAVLQIETDPPGATIFFDRRDLGSRGLAPRALAVKPGAYRVFVELPGYEPVEPKPVEAVVGEQTVLTFRLERTLGTVRVLPVGAPHVAVRVDDEDGPLGCDAPCDLPLPPGPHLLYFTHHEFEARPRQVLVAARQTTSIKVPLTALRGSVVVDTDERGAAVEIDGEPRGFTPASIPNVPVGKRHLRIHLRGFEPIERDIEVRPNQQVSLLGLELDPIRQVTAVSRQAEDIDLAPSSLTIIDGRELRAFGYPTIAEALRGTRGMALSNDRSYVSAAIRGIGEPNDYGCRLLVLSDGLSLNDNIYNSSYIGSDGRIDLHDIERIEVVRGPGSLLYGTGAFSGVVNLVTRSGESPEGVHVGLGTHGGGVARGRAGTLYRFSENAGLWASVSVARSDGFDLPVELSEPIDGQRIATAHGTDAFGAIGTAGRAWWGPLTAQWFYNERKLFIPVGSLNTRFDDPRTYYHDRRIAGEVRVEPKWSMVELLGRIYANHYRFQGFYVGRGEDPSLFEDMPGSWLGTEARVVVKPLDELRLSVGGEVQVHPTATMFGAEATEEGEVVPGTAYLDEKHPYGFGALYALLEATPVEWFRPSAGARVDLYSTFGAIVVPRGALVFRPTTGGVLKVMGGRAFRAPNISEQFYNDGGYSQVAAVDSDRGRTLAPESIYSAEVEYLQRFAADWVVLGAAHFGYADQLIGTILDESSAGPDEEVIRYANSPVPIIVAGGDVELRREWRRGWMLAGFYGYQHGRLLDPSDPALASNPRIVNAPEHLAGFKGAAPLSGALAVAGVRASLEAPRRIDYASDDETRPALVVDATISGASQEHGVSYVVGVYNLFDWKYDVPVTDTFASRTIRQNGRTLLVDVVLSTP